MLRGLRWRRGRRSARRWREARGGDPAPRGCGAYVLLCNSRTYLLLCTSQTYLLLCNSRTYLLLCTSQTYLLLCNSRTYLLLCNSQTYLLLCNSRTYFFHVTLIGVLVSRALVLAHALLVRRQIVLLRRRAGHALRDELLAARYDASTDLLFTTLVWLSDLIPTL